MSIQSSQGNGVSTQVNWSAFVGTTCKAIQLSIERSSFEGKLEAIIRAANAHNSVGLSPGAAQFKLLREQAIEMCADFAKRWEIAPELLEAQIPAITKLRSLADPPPKANATLLVMLGIITASATFFLLGVLGGLASVGYHVVGGR